MPGTPSPHSGRPLNDPIVRAPDAHRRSDGQPRPSQLTLVHVTHEGTEQLGGIGTVLQGLLTSPVYRRAVGRSILVGPLGHADSTPARPIDRLGPFATELIYSGPDHVDVHGFGAILRPVEWAFGVRLVYGKRFFGTPGAEHDESQRASAEVLLIDVNKPNAERMAALKWLFSEQFGIDSRRYEAGWDYEEWCRLADPAYHALCVLLAEGAPLTDNDSAPPAVVLAHEFMGIATALRCSLDQKRFRTAFHAHECSTARRIVEALPGHDVAFYPAMRAAVAKGLHVSDTFGDQSHFARHALVESTHHLGAVLAVGPETAEELRFLSPRMGAAPVRVAYNGLPAAKVIWDAKRRSRDLMNRWLESVIGRVPDFVLTHVTRPVSSKGLWRDAKVCRSLSRRLEAVGKSAVYVLVTCGAPIRNRAQANSLARSHGWPARHTEGYPDLDGPELDVFRDLAGLTESASSAGLTAIMVNQFGWGRERLGDACPAEMTFDDLRRATDAELGLSTYEPFGIAPLEPLHAGAVCAVSTVSGCMGLVNRAMLDLGLSVTTCPLVLPADFVAASERVGLDADRPIGASERDAIEERVCNELAAQIFDRLPASEQRRKEYLEIGQLLAHRMSWDVVVEQDFLPAIYSTLPAGMAVSAPG